MLELELIAEQTRIVRDVEWYTMRLQRVRRLIGETEDSSLRKHLKRYANRLDYMVRSVLPKHAGHVDNLLGGARILK